MRLIDADRMKVVLDKNFGHTSGAIVLANLIDMQPTAYDVEAVVRELGKISNGCGEIPLEEAIEIVRGGRNEDSKGCNSRMSKL